MEPLKEPDRTLDILGHELDNVLNGLLGMARLLRQSGLNPEQDRWSRAIEQSGRQMRRLVSAFRGEAGAPAAAPPGPDSACRASPPVRAPAIDGIDLLEQAVLSQAPLAVARRNRLLLDVDPALPRYWNTDPCRLRQLLDNLLGNANKFTQAGEILLRAVPARAAGSVRALTLVVTDTGPGVDPRSANRIFEAGVGGSGGGSGLGLYVCRAAVEALGGTIGLSSPPGGGARFEVALPGALPATARASQRLTRAYGRLECRLDLSGPLRVSVAGWLTRLGAPWRDAGRGAAGGDADRLALRISELPDAGEPAPLLLLAPDDAAAPSRYGGMKARRLAAPIMGSSLGPVLLEMLLEWSWLRPGLRRGRRG